MNNRVKYEERLARRADASASRTDCELYETGPEVSAIAHTVESFSKDVNIGRTTIYKEIREGKLQALKIGRRTIITEEAKRRYIASLPSVGAGQ